MPTHVNETVGQARGRKKAKTVPQVPDALVAYGESFLQMFEDYDDTTRQPLVQDQADNRGSACAATTSNTSKACVEQQAQPAATSAVEAAVATAVGKPKKQQLQQRNQGGASTTGRTSPAQLRPQLARPSWKDFMSPKAARVHSSSAAAPVAGSGGAGAKEGLRGEQGAPSREDFERMRREVELYGAGGLDKKDRKAFEARRLAAVGAKAAKPPRRGAYIGKGIAKKGAERETAALELAIESGMVQRKGLGKKRARERAAKAGKVDRGLREDGGAVRGGLLRLRAPPASNKPKLGRLQSLKF